MTTERTAASAHQTDDADTVEPSAASLPATTTEPRLEEA
jgi:hypothetical protein